MCCSVDTRDYLCHDLSGIHRENYARNEKKTCNVLKKNLGLLFQRQMKYNYAISYTEQVNVYAHER